MLLKYLVSLGRCSLSQSQSQSALDGSRGPEVLVVWRRNAVMNRQAKVWGALALAGAISFHHRQQQQQVQQQDITLFTRLVLFVLQYHLSFLIPSLHLLSLILASFITSHRSHVPQ